MLEDVLGKLVRHFVPRLAAWDCEVVSANADGTVDIKPASERLGPGLMGVPVALQGCWSVKVSPGARCKLEFLDGDLSKPVVTQVISGTILEATIEAQTIKVLGTTTQIGGSTDKVLLGIPPTDETANRVAVGAIGDSTPSNGVLTLVPPLPRTIWMRKTP